MELSPPGLADLSIDGKILAAMKDKGKVVVIGTRYSGLTKTRERILGKLEAGKLGFNDSNIVESQISTSVLDSLPDVVKTLSVAKTQEKHVVFINDYWKSVTENPPDWLRDEPFSQHLPDLEEFFATHANDVIPLIVGEEDAKCIIRSYFKEEHAIPESNLHDFPEEALLRLAQFGDKDEVTYIPKVIVETLQDWTGKNREVIEKLRHPKSLLSPLLPSKEEQEIKKAFKDLENDLKLKLEANIEILAILGIASPLVSALTNSENAVGNIFSLLGMKTLAGSAFFGLPVTLGFLTASLISLVVAKKKGVPESQKKEFERLGKAFTKAQDFWHNGLTKTQKGLFCYKLDKEYRRPLGTSEKDLDEHYMNYKEREAKWNELRDNIKSAADNLSLGQQAQVQILLKPFSERLQAVETGLELVKRELDAEREERINADLAIEQKLAIESEKRLKLQGKLEKTLAGILGTPTEVTPADLHEVPQFSIYENRQPLSSPSIHEIVATTIEALGEGRKVVILGEAGVGKTTVLYLICRSLIIRGNRIFIGGVSGLRPDEISFHDNIDSDTAQAVAKDSANPAIATCRLENWNTGEGHGWLALKLTRDDYPREILRRILIECLNADSVSYTEEGVERALDRSEGLPGYLVELVSSCRASGKGLTKETADAAPSKSIGVIEDAILSIREFHALELLYALALTSKSRLQRIHLQTLLAEGQSVQTEATLPIEFVSLALADAESVFRLGHDLWLDALTKPWVSLGQTGREEPDNLKRLRESGTFTSRLNAMFQSSIASSLELKGAVATKAVMVTLENRPLLAGEILDSIMNRQSISTYPHLVGVFELLAVRNPAVIKERYLRFVENITGEKFIDRRIFVLMYTAETLLFKSERYNLVQLEETKGLIPVMPISPEFPAPAFSLTLLEEAEKLLSEHSAEVDDLHFTRAKLLSDLGSIKTTLGKRDDSLLLLREAADEWRLACCDEEGLLAGFPVRFHDSLDNLGVALIAAEKYPEAISCLTAAIRSVRLIWESWSIFIKAKAAIDPDSNLPEDKVPARIMEFVRRSANRSGSVAPNEITEGLARLISTYKAMENSASFAQGKNGLADALPEVSHYMNSAYIGPLEVPKAFASSMSNLEEAFKQSGQKSEWSQVHEIAFKLKNWLLSIYEKQENLPAAADGLISISKYLRPDSSIKAVTQALDIYRKLVVDDDSFLPKLGNALRILAIDSVDVPGKLESAISEWTEAEGIYYQLASVQSRFFIDHARVAINLANALMDQGDFTSASKYFRRAEGSLRDSSSAQEYTELMAQAAWGMGEAESHVPDWDLAIKYYRDAEIYFAGVGSKSSDDLRQRARGLIGLGEAYLIGKKQPDLAVEPFEQAIELLKRIQNPGNEDIVWLVTATDRLGAALEAKGDNSGALVRYLEASEFNRRLPLDAPRVAAGLAVGLLKIVRLKEQKDGGEGVEHDLKEAEMLLEPFRVDAAEPSWDIAYAYANLGKVYKDFKLYPRSVACYEASVAESLRLAQRDHRSIRSWTPILNDYMEVLVEANDVRRAVQFYQQLSEFLKKLKDPEEYVQAQLASALGNFGYWLLKNGETERSITALRDAAEICARLTAISRAHSEICQQINRGLTEALSRLTPSSEE